MNFATVPTVQEYIIQRAQHPMFGYFNPRSEYFDRIVEWQSRRNGVEGLLPEHIGYENGVLGGVVSTLRAYVQPGDAVLVHSPTYIGFTKSIEAAGYRIVHSPLKLDDRGVWRMDFEDMERKLAQNHIHAAVFCSPHNPCGRVWERDEIERVKARQASYAGLLLNARATADDGSKLTVSFPAGSTFAIKMLGRADTQSVVLPTVSAVFGRRTVDYVLDGGGTPAPQHEEHSPSARAAVSADPQPVSSAAPVSSSASAPQQQATPVMAPTPSAPEPVAPKPAAPVPGPKPAAAPAPKSSDLAKAPWLRSDNPAGAPATGKLPTEPAPRAPERASAPKAQPAAPSAPWESEQVPYDDVMVGGFAADAGGDDLPPFDVPGAASAPKPAATAPKEEGAPAAPWESNPGAGSPFGHQGAAPSIPQTEDEAKALIRSVFGQSTIFKPVE